MEKETRLYFPEMERDIIASIMIEPGLFYDAKAELDAGMFSDLHCKNVWRLICKNEREGKPYDLMAIAPMYQTENMDIVSFLEYFQPNTTSVLFMRNVQMVKEYYHRRRLRVYLQKVLMQVTDPAISIDDIQKGLFGISSGLDNAFSEESYSTSRNVAKKIFDSAVKRFRGEEKSQALNTGFALIDNACGLKPGHLFVIAAQSSQGKTSLATDIAVNVALEGHPVLFFSLEMNDTEVMARVMSRYADLSSRFITDAAMERHQLDRLKYAMEVASRMNIMFDDKERFNVNRMCASIRRSVRKHKTRLVVIDYLQIFGQSGSREMNQVQFYGEITRMFKNLAEELQITIILISQLSRDRDHPVPTLSRLRGSGEIEENANEVLFVYRPERLRDAGVTSYPEEFVGEPIVGTAMLILAKCRGGECGKCIVNFDGRTTHFSERDKEGAKKENSPIPSAAAEEEEIPF